MSLTTTLTALFNRARQRHSPQETSLLKGLHVRVHHQLPQFFIWRETGDWTGTGAAEREAVACAKALGWGGNYLLEWKGRYLVCTRVEALLEARA